MQPNVQGMHHDHVDGSAAVFDCIDELYVVAGKPFPFVDKDEWLRFFRNGEIDIVSRFATVTNVLQGEETIELLAYNYGARRAQEGLKYVEAKFAPWYHSRENVFLPDENRSKLSMREATAAFVNGLWQAENECKIRLVPSICINRETDEDTGVRIAEIVMDYAGEAILDLVCDEDLHPPEKHLKAYQTTFGTDVPRDCHAGERVRPGRTTYDMRLAQNVWTALLDLKVHSIGHGIPVGNSPDLLSYIAEEGVRITGCPLSNLSEGRISTLRTLHIDRILDKDITYTLNPDDDLFMPDLQATVSACDAEYMFTKSQARKLEENVFKGALGPDPKRYV